MTKAEPARPIGVEFVLCKRSSRATLFAQGAHPGVAVFQEDGGRARRFLSVAEALAYRAGLAHAEAEVCAVFQFLPNGLIIPPE